MQNVSEHGQVMPPPETADRSHLGWGGWSELGRGLNAFNLNSAVVKHILLAQTEAS